MQRRRAAMDDGETVDLAGSSSDDSGDELAAAAGASAAAGGHGGAAVAAADDVQQLVDGADCSAMPWACGYCTFVNVNVLAPVCEVCSKPRDAHQPASASGGDTASASGGDSAAAAASPAAAAADGADGGEELSEESLAFLKKNKKIGTPFCPC